MLTRDLVRLRRELGDLRDGAYASLAAPPGVWAWRRGERTVVAVNLSDREASVAGAEGAIRISTDRERDGEAVSGSLRLPPWQGAVVS